VQRLPGAALAALQHVRVKEAVSIQRCVQVELSFRLLLLLGCCLEAGAYQRRLELGGAIRAVPELQQQQQIASRHPINTCTNHMASRL
jgi:hypothetical protein